MAKITRKTQQIFGGLLAAPQNIAQFGSLAAGSPVYSTDPDVIQALAAYANGWRSALINVSGGKASPTMQDDNALNFLWSRQLAYLMQTGMPEYDPATIYFINSYCQLAGVLYVCTVDNTVGVAPTVTNNWKTYASTLMNIGASSMKAWVNFVGTGGIGACAILSSFNCSGVQKNAAGSYLITFAANLADANYGFAGSTGTPNGGAPAAGDNNVVVGGIQGRAIVRTVSQLSVFAWDTDNSRPEDASIVSVNIFGN